MLGARRFLAFYASSLVAGGLFWSALHWGRPAVIFGASAGASALVILFACFFPNRETTQLFFFLPISFKPKHLAYLLFAFDLLGLVFYEILGAASPFGASAHSVRLGGMAAGWLYFRYVHDSNWGFSRERADIELPRWMKHRGPAKSDLPAPNLQREHRGTRAPARRGGPHPRQDQQRRFRVAFSRGEEGSGRGEGPDRQAIAADAQGSTDPRQAEPDDPEGVVFGKGSSWRVRCRWNGIRAAPGAVKRATIWPPSLNSARSHETIY